VVAQDPAGGSPAQQTSTVTISVAEAASPTPEVVPVPSVIGLPRGAAVAQLRGAGFGVDVSYQAECDVVDPACQYVPGVVWAQSPDAGQMAEVSSVVTIVVSP
jgi:beta-lactam-binding protein with PASTA domain